MRDEKEQMKRLSSWYRHFLEEMINGEREVRRNAEMTKLDIDRT